MQREMKETTPLRACEQDSPFVTKSAKLAVLDDLIKQVNYGSNQIAPVKQWEHKILEGAAADTTAYPKYQAKHSMIGVMKHNVAFKEILKQQKRKYHLALSHNERNPKEGCLLI